jgi:hypothetical protein
MYQHQERMHPANQEIKKAEAPVNILGICRYQNMANL